MIIISVNTKGEYQRQFYINSNLPLFSVLALLSDISCKTTLSFVVRPFPLVVMW